MNDIVKINSDASIGNDFASIGAVARNHKGRVLKVKVWREYIQLPKAAEAVAILHGVMMAYNEGLTRICCESDSKSVIQSLDDPVNCSAHCAMGS